MGKFERIVTDVMGPLPTTAHSNRYILIFMDHFTKCIKAIAMPAMTTKKVVKYLVERIIFHYGAPQVILSDNASYFIADLLKQVCCVCGIHKQTSTAYHLQTNGVVERINCTIKMILATFVNGNTAD